MATREPLWLGTGFSYSPEEDRLLISNLLGGPRATFTPSTTLGNRPAHGVVRLGDLAVTQDGTPGMRVLVGAGSAFVAGSSNAEQGSYAVRNDAALTVNLAASDATQRRNDIVVARITDADYSGSTRTFTIEIVQGALYSGAHNTANDPVLPASCLALARVQVAAADTSITNAEITDLRQFISPLSTLRRGTSVQRGTAIDLENGDKWFETDTGRVAMYYNSAWIFQEGPPPRFRVTGGAGGQTGVASGGGGYNCTWANGTEVIDTEGAIAIGTGVFTCPATLPGRWHFEFGVGIEPAANGIRAAWLWHANTSRRYAQSSQINQGGAGSESFTGTAEIVLAAAETVVVQVYQTSGANRYVNTSADQYFQGRYVGPA